MKLAIGLVLLLMIMILAAVMSNTWLMTPKSPVETPTETSSPSATPQAVITNPPHPLLVLTYPQDGQTVSSPLQISGQARGNWFFEASFPVVLTNWDGLIIAEGFATAQGDWMTEEFVPFTAELTFTPDTTVSDRGALILQKANASGLPENDDAYEITVFFE